MPLPLEVTFADGTVEEVVLPVEIWKQDPSVCTKMFVGPHGVVRVRLDPRREIADADRSNNAFPPEVTLGRFGLTPSRDRSNPMQSARASDGRPRVEEAARSIAVAIVPAWDELLAANAAATPIATSGSLVDAVESGLLVDPWNRVMRLEFASASPMTDDEVLATLRSDGADGRRNTDDDVALVILADGRVLDEAIAIAEREN